MSYRASLFGRLSPAEQLAVLRESPPAERSARIRALPLDDAADLIQAAPDAQRDGLLALLEDAARTEVRALLAYAEDVAGGLMNPQFVAPSSPVQCRRGDSLFAHPRTRLRSADQRCIRAGRRAAPAWRRVATRSVFLTCESDQTDCVMMKDPITVSEDADQEAVGQPLPRVRPPLGAGCR